MKVILLKELKGKGGEGDIVEVAAGFANNYLLPEGFAIKATEGNIKQLEQRKANIAKREEVRLADAQKTKDSLEGTKVRVFAQVGSEGQLFGSVTTQMIADAVKAALDIELDKRRIELSGAIKVAGEHKIAVSIYRDIKAFLTIEVGDEKSFAAADKKAADEAAAVEEQASEAVQEEVAAE
ncbi:MAG: 50S ribosomal protein L9 [Eggerthellaceae bacterium]|nr:50S ribosomal protein L9 [Eggerthellaceae bacterium]